MEEEHDVDQYITQMETVVKQKLGLYQNLYSQILKLKKRLQDEEETHKKVASKVYC